MCHIVRTIVGETDPNIETRADVCEDCRFCVRREPLTCKLITKAAQDGRRTPCPHMLAIRLASDGAACPSPNAETRQRWAEAPIKAVPQVVVTELQRQQLSTAIGRKDRQRPNLARRGMWPRVFSVARR